MRTLYTSLFLCLLTLATQAQNTCISQQDQPLDGSALLLESDLQRWLHEHPQATSAREVVQIPTVVHVVWKNAQENIADSLIHRTIELVNKDWRRQNNDTVNTPDHFLPVAADMGIELVLASIDPEGNATDGITRTYSDSVEFVSWLEHMKYDSTGGKSAWDADSYLNVWVIRSSPTEFGGGIVLGQSTMPGLDYEVPGLVISTDQFHNYGANPDKNWRVMTHELGHFFCLIHTCAYDNCSNADMVDDTPICRLDSVQFPTNCVDNNSCGNTNGDMHMNHMGWLEYDCANLFTEGQRERAIGCINTNYPGLLTSPALGIGSMERPTIAIQPNPTTGILRFDAKTAGTYTVTDLMGRALLNGTATQGQNTIDMTALPDGIHLLRLQDGESARVVKVGN